jgi:PAS domain S-box-containing protein
VAGLVTLVGWALDIGVFKNVFAGLTTMKPNTALLLVLSGLALALLSREIVGGPARIAAGLVGFTVILFGGLSLSESIFAWDLLIDRLLVHGSPGGARAMVPGRMSPAISFLFMLLGTSFLAACGKLRGLRLAVISALGAVCVGIGGLSIVGCLAVVLFHFGFLNYTGMAIHSAAAFTALGLGLMALARLKGGAGWSLGKMTTGGFLIGVLTLLLVAAESYNSTQQLIQAAAWVSHTQEVLKEVQRISSETETLASSPLAFINVGDERLLEPYIQSKNLIGSDIEGVRTLTADNSHQQRRIDDLEPLIAKRIRWGDEIINARRQHSFSEDEQVVATTSGVALSDNIQPIIQSMEDEEYLLLDQRQKKEDSVSTTTFLILPMGVFISLTILSIGLFFLNAGISGREQLEKGNARLAAIVESSDDAIIGKDLAGTITSWNAGAENIFGYSEREMIGQPILRIIPADRQHEEAAILGSIRRGESVRHFDTVRLRKDLSAVDISVTVSAIRSSTGKIIGASKVARDITDRKRAEAAILASEGRYRALFEHAPDGIIIADRESNYVDANSSVCRMLGYTRDELIKLNASDIVSHAEVQHIAPALKAINAKANHYREWSFRRKDGSAFEAEVIATMMPDGNLLGMIRDITDRKRAELEKLESEARLNFALETVHIGEWDLDLVNHSAHRTLEHDRIFGYGSLRPSWTFEMFLEHVLPEDRSAVDRKFREAVAAQVKWDFECRIRRVDGDVLWIWAVGTHMRDKQGQMRRLVGIVQDITERKVAENTIRQLNDELEQRVIDRTAQLEAANRELEAFSYSVSHDLRTPLRAVDGFSRAVVEDFGPALPDEGKRQLQVICDSAQHMGELIDDLLAFSRMSRQPLSKRTVITEELVRAVLVDLNVEPANREAQIRIGSLPSCEGDPSLLKQVWINLISNALKYSRKRDQAVIEIGCVREKGEDVFFVRDNGTGFNMRYADKLFGVFQRLHRAEDYEGTGVGLAIVQRIVHRHGGRVWADAVVDRGATFHFTLEPKDNA